MRQARSLWEMYLDFKRGPKELGVGHEAHQRWLLSEDRRKVLTTVSLSDLKKGRFVESILSSNRVTIDTHDSVDAAVVQILHEAESLLRQDLLTGDPRRLCCASNRVTADTRDS